MNQNANESEKYKGLLVLSYFKSHYKNYDFNEMLETMGMTKSKLMKKKEKLLDKKYLIYCNAYIVISKKGEDTLRRCNVDIFSKNSNHMEVEDNQINTKKVFIPKGFLGEKR